MKIDSPLPLRVKLDIGNSIIESESADDSIVFSFAPLNIQFLTFAILPAENEIVKISSLSLIGTFVERPIESPDWYSFPLKSLPAPDRKIGCWDTVNRVSTYVIQPAQFVRQIIVKLTQNTPCQPESLLFVF
jgi:hypothetical protein